VLAQYWGWTLNDFKRELANQLLAQKVVSVLDAGTNQRARTALAQLSAGADFGAVAKSFSDDTTTSVNNGQFPFTISQGNKDLSPQTLNEIFQLKAGQVSGIINIGSGLEIIKVISVQGNQITASHILFNYKSINSFISPLEQSQKTNYYIKIK
jgi:hypothetical protein